MMRDRIKAGLARARAQGKRLGRPPVPPEVEQAIRDARAEGKGMLKIAKGLPLAGVLMVELRAFQVRAASTGRTHGCTRLFCINVKTTLANRAPSTHGDRRKCPNARICDRCWL